MLRLVRTDSDNQDFQSLVMLLDHYLAEIDDDEHAFYAQFNKVASLSHVVVAYLDDAPVGCGAFKPYAAETVEIKRMFVQPAHRGQGVARAVLAALEQWAAELGYAGCVLETGQRQAAAIALYQRSGYARTPNYGQYVGVENSVCLAKALARP
ncbi:GNAT family N-acetyltransferase [Hymenobacter sp. PAMC 26628]|uniref:GNAT family N-acetyltransferase n=1 Tax=Hymenobacter sp. PAMC 26628 TaxID=1484118 RepID=UPI0007700391|nr:GNAT family N-acetyltransferase [Hymenobacter sp. PAMC 26628]AMJ67609.1 GNAT family acetyltransferase [Hymenobacter sp. PAMC 26628]